MLGFGCIGLCIISVYINVCVVESVSQGYGVRLSGASNFPPNLVDDYVKRCGIESGGFSLVGVKDLYSNPKVSKLVKLINDWYSTNNYVGSGVKSLKLESDNTLHIICDELKVDKYIPIEIHTYKSGSNKSVDVDPPNSFVTLYGSKIIGIPINKQGVSNTFILDKLGLIPGHTFKWDHSRWLAIDSCGLFGGTSVVKLSKNPKEGTVTLHVYVIENPTKVIGPFLGNILNAYKEPVFGLKFQHINLLSSGIVGTLSTCIGLSTDGLFNTRPYKITASITHDILESFVWLRNGLNQACKVLSLKVFAGIFF